MHRRVTRAEFLEIIEEQMDSIFHPEDDLGHMDTDGKVDIVDVLPFLADVLDSQLGR